MRLFLTALFLILPLSAQAQSYPREVDVELVLAVDVSRSMTPAELEIQRRGYVEAIMSDDVIGAIRSGMIGEIALTYVEWAGPSSQRVVVDWTIIGGREDAQAFVDTLNEHFELPLRRTSISGIIDFAMDSLNSNDIRGLRRVIDVSGDGPNNQGGPVSAARDRAVADGIVINGLPLMTRDGAYQRWNIDDLDAYYQDCVIGGPGAFSIPVYDWSQFAEAVRRKLVLEIAGRPTERIWKAQFVAEGRDCMIGEKIWQRNRSIFDEP